MSFVDTLFPVLMNMLYVGIALVSIRYLYIGYFFIIRKNELIYVRSQVSALKMKLRSRLNQKLNATQATGVSDLKTAVNKILEEIRLLDFTNPGDYQTLINKIIEINTAHETHNMLHKKNSVVPSGVDVSIAPEFDKIRETCQSVFEFEPDLMCLVIEIAKFTEDYIKRAHDYNHYTIHEKKIPKIKDIPEKIQIEHYYVFEELYKQHRAVIEARISQSRATQASGDTNLSSIPTSLADPSLESKKTKTNRSA